MTLDTPCIKVCIMDPASDLCRGCGRTLAEIGAWSTMSAAARRMVMAGLAARMQAAGLPPPPAPSADRATEP